MERYVCLHGHFYQPPRENPWLEAIEVQDSAYPYHDWNERIDVECYAPNGASRILDPASRIERIVNNYSRISFNFGPTLLSWLESNAPDTYRAILDADRASQVHFSGHGSGLAQVYNHMILPLANRRDRETQVLWGIRDFEHRFGRRPEGMWLAETAADLESLDILAAHGIRFTILAPSQARRVRPIGGRWRDVSGGRVDPTMAYQVKLPSGGTIAVFFYDGPVSRAVAFEGLLANGERFANRLTGVFSDSRSWPQLVHIATDGESYGHHHRNGDMALAYALHLIEQNESVNLTIYGEYLERHPPTHQAEIFERSSWSCAHGVDRWWSDCGCNSGGHPGWNQAWRTPLRQALDGLRDELTPRFEDKARALLGDPWAARDDYIEIILGRSQENERPYWSRHAAHELAPEERVLALKLLELQRHAMLMYTSCGWFFDELSGLETVQIIQYAGRAIQLAREVLDFDPEPVFLERMAEAKSNIPDHRDGARVYEKFVKPATVDLNKVAAHYALSSLFEDYAESDRIFCYSVQREDEHTAAAGRQRLLAGRARLSSEITGESALLSYGVLHFGDHNLQAGVREFRGAGAYDQLVQEAEQAFTRGELPEVIRLFDRHFEGVTFSLRSLFRDEQRKITNLILETTLAEAEASLRQIYENHAPLLRFLAEIGTPPPKALHAAADFVLNNALRRALKVEELDLEQIRILLDAAHHENVTLDQAGLAYEIGQALEERMKKLAENPENLPLLKEIRSLADMAADLPFEVNFWDAQNLYYEMMTGIYPEMTRRETPEARDWVEAFASLGEKIRVRVAE